MIALYIDGKYVELFDDENITLTKQVRNFKDVTSVVSDYTKSFNVPATDANNAIFTHYYDISIVNGYNPHVKVDASIEVDSLPVFDGVIELLGVAFDHNEPKSYQIVFYGATKSLASIYGEDTLRSVNWSALNHTANTSNVISSWSGTLLSGQVKYPVWDYHEGVTWGLGVDVPHNVRITGRGFAIDDLRPALRLKDAVRYVIEHAGYNLEANGLLDGDYFDHLYMLPVSQAGRIYDPTLKDDYKFDADQTNVLDTTAVGYTTLVYSVTTGNAGGALDITTGEYTAEFTGQYDFYFQVGVASFTPASGYTPNLQIVAYVNGTYHNTILTVTGTGQTAITFSLNIAKGDVVTIRHSCPTGCRVSNYEWRCDTAPYGMAGQTINFSEIMPNVKITDFLQGVLKTFNAVIFLEGGVYRIENVDDWYDQGSIVDWSKYIDMSSATHKKVSIPKRIAFSHAKMNDITSIDFFKRNNREFGSVEFRPDVDFTDGELVVQSPFGIVVPSILNKINGQYKTIGVTDLNVPILLDSDMKPAAHNLMLFFMDSADYEASDSYFAMGALRTSYPHAGVFDEFTARSRSRSLAFSLEQDINGSVPNVTLYSEFWSRYIARIFAKSSRRVTMKGYIPVGEWLNLDMAQTIRVNDYYYKIEDMSYNIVTGEASMNLFTYTPVELGVFETTDDSVNFPSDYISPASENLIFTADEVLESITNTRSVGGSRYVNLGARPKNVSQMQYVTQGMTNVIANQYPKHLHMEKGAVDISVSASVYTIIQEYDSLEDYNNGYISGNTTTGQWTTSSGTWVEVSCSVAWDGHDKLKVALLRDGIALKEQEVFQSSGSITLIDTTYLSDVSILEVGLIYTGGGEDRTFNIQADFEINQMP